MHSQTKKPVNIWFYSARSIGVTLLGLYGLEQAKRHFPNRKIRLFLVLTERNSLYTQMLKEHCDVEIVFLIPRNILHVLGLFIRTLFQENHWVFPPSFGRYPFLIQGFAFLLTRNARSNLIGFSDQVNFFENLFYSKINQTNYSESIFKQVGSVFNTKTPPLPPNLLFCQDAEFRAGLSSKYVIFHPYGAGRKRSYPSSLSLKLLKHLSTNYSGYTVIVSGGPADEAQARKLIKELSTASVEFIGDLSQGNFSNTMQIIANAALYIGVDTGITHIAVHMNTPCLVLGNRSNPMWLPTYGSQVKILVGEDKCPCDGKKGGGCNVLVGGQEFFTCLVGISWQHITDTVESILHE